MSTKTMTPPSETARGRWRTLALAAGAVAALIGLWTLLPASDWIVAFRDWVAQQGLWGHVIFAAVYVLATLALAPGGILTLAAGFAFGLWAFPTVIVGATIGASLSFLIGRYLARGWVERQASGSRLFKALDKAIESEGWKIVGLMRLSPLVPFNLQNYFFGVTKVGFLPYLTTSFFGIMPGTLLYVWIGSLGAMAGSVGVSSDDASFYRTVALVVGLLATLAVTIIVSRKAQQKLREIGVTDESGAA
jgi:uncharacterized membrane protein YdjX (TVP38/TMEM64 family)